MMFIPTLFCVSCGLLKEGIVLGAVVRPYVLNSRTLEYIDGPESQTQASELKL